MHHGVKIENPARLGANIIVGADGVNSIVRKVQDLHSVLLSRGSPDARQFMRDNWLSNRIFRSYADILDHCCFAWNRLVDQPWRIMSIGLRNWAHE